MKISLKNGIFYGKRILPWNFLTAMYIKTSSIIHRVLCVYAILFLFTISMKLNDVLFVCSANTQNSWKYWWLFIHRRIRNVCIACRVKVSNRFSKYIMNHMTMIILSSKVKFKLNQSKHFGNSTDHIIICIYKRNEKIISFQKRITLFNS